ncbi:transposase, partial [Carnobacterium mobile]
LLTALEEERGKGRNDYPVHTMWRAFVASFVFQHRSVASLIRELKRNSQLRELCGFQPHFSRSQKGRYRVQLAPTEAAFSRFLKKLLLHQHLLDEMFTELVTTLYETLDGFGQTLALDGKIIPSYATKPNKKVEHDGRRDTEADFTLKQYTTTTANGEKITKKKTWFGYRLHLIVDANYELPVAYEVTKASEGEPTVAKRLIKHFSTSQAKQCDYLLADRGYDGAPLLSLIESKEIIPIIDIKNQWDKDTLTKQYRDSDLIYTYNGAVSYVDGKGNEIKLAYKGYDKKTDSLRYGFKPQYQDNRLFRIKREEDRRIFNKVARDSFKFKRIYKKRTSIERVNGRIDRDYLFENHTIRGKKKLNLFVT